MIQPAAYVAADDYCVTFQQMHKACRIGSLHYRRRCVAWRAQLNLSADLLLAGQVKIALQPHAANIIAYTYEPFLA
jgi:hypothetical protein